MITTSRPSAWLLTALALCSAAATAGNIEASLTSAANVGEAIAAGEACSEEGGQCPSVEGEAMEALNVLERRFERGQATDLQEGSDTRGGHAETPSVFNFYHPGFQPDGLPVGAVGPEAEIFTMPHVVSFINGVGTMVDYGAPQWRGGLFYNSGAHGGEGSLNYTGKGSKSETIDELDLLLTGGRMGKEGRALVEREYDAAGLPAAQKVGDSACVYSVLPLTNGSLATGKNNGHVEVSKTSSGAQLRRWQTAGWVCCLVQAGATLVCVNADRGLSALLPDGTTASGGKASVSVLRTETWTVQRTLELGVRDKTSPVWALAQLSGGHLAAGGDKDLKDIQILGLQDGSCTALYGHTADVNALHGHTADVNGHRGSAYRLCRAIKTT